VILRCTRKLIAILKTSADPNPQPGPEDWYANLLWLDRRKCLLLTHAGTLFSIFEPGLPAAELRDTRNRVTRLIGSELAAENLRAATFGSLDCEDLTVARTADRSVLGCMNDMAVMCEYAVMDSGGLDNVDLAEVNQSLHRNINIAADTSGQSIWPPAEPTTETDHTAANRTLLPRTVCGCGLAILPKVARGLESCIAAMVRCVGAGFAGLACRLRCARAGTGAASRG
jgi:hypothetical protein